MNTRSIPIDTARVADTPISEEEWEQSKSAHARFKALVESKPKAKARYDAVLAEINSRQATRADSAKTDR